MVQHGGISRSVALLNWRSCGSTWTGSLKTSLRNLSGFIEVFGA